MSHMKNLFQFCEDQGYLSAAALFEQTKSSHPDVEGEDLVCCEACYDTGQDNWGMICPCQRTKR